MTVHDVRIEVTPLQTEGMRDVRGDVVRRQLIADHGIDVGIVRSICGYLVRSQYDASSITPRVQDIFSDPIIEFGAVDTSIIHDAAFFSETPSLSDCWIKTRCY